MSVTAVHLWTCDLCGCRIAQAEGTSAWSDPVIEPPQGWDAQFAVPSEFRKQPTMDICDACVTCQQSPNWSNYRESH